MSGADVTFIELPGVLICRECNYPSIKGAEDLPKGASWALVFCTNDTCPEYNRVVRIKFRELEGEYE